MHEKKIVVIYQEKMLFFLEFLGSLKKKVPKRLSFLKTSKMGVVEVEFHRSQIMIEIKKIKFFDTFFILVAVFQLPNLHWTVANFFFEKRSIEAIFGVVAIRILVAI